MSAPTSTRETPKGDSPAEPQIDPALADLPPPPHHPSNGSAPAHAAGTLADVPAIVTPRDSPYPRLTGVPGEPTSITESIALAPNPHTADFSPLPFTTDDSIDVTALDDAATDEPGSPTARLLRAIAPPNAAQPNPNWPPVSCRMRVARPHTICFGSCSGRPPPSSVIHAHTTASTQCQCQSLHRCVIQPPPCSPFHTRTPI